MSPEFTIFASYVAWLPAATGSTKTDDDSSMNLAYDITGMRFEETALRMRVTHCNLLFFRRSQYASCSPCKYLHEASTRNLQRGW